MKGKGTEGKDSLSLWLWVSPASDFWSGIWRDLKEMFTIPNSIDLAEGFPRETSPTTRQCREAHLGSGAGPLG